MLDQIIVGASVLLIAALVSGLTFVAYRHPKGYDSIALVPLMVLGIFGIFLLGMYAQHTISAGIYPFDLSQLPEDPQEAFNLIGATSGPPWPYFYHVFIADVLLFAYMTFLFTLPSILELDDSDDDD